MTRHKEDPLAIAGLRHQGQLFWDLSAPALYEEAIKRNEGALSEHGPLIIHTGKYTGRQPKDKFIVRDSTTDSLVDWGSVNQPFLPEAFAALKEKISHYLVDKDLFVQNSHVGADRRYRVPVRVISTLASHALFARNLFLQDPRESYTPELPSYTLLHAPGFNADPSHDGTRSEAFVILNFTERLILIGGTQYAGEIKKALFTVMTFLMPQKGVFPMHCSANHGEHKDDVAIFFGLSGTGKTTLSASPERTLVGDDEHGWADDGVFNFEGGCYAKVIGLSPEREPEIYATTRRFGTVLENVTLDPQTRKIDLNDATLTENTRAAYPISHLSNVAEQGVAGHPRNVIMLTCDAFGVLPPIARLTPEQAMYHFLSGYTAKVAGTEAGVTEPQATFSACFGAPFMALPARTYADLLGQKIQRHKSDVWLVNTGWSGGPYSEGKRMPLPITRALVTAILNGSLHDAPLRTERFFNLRVPQSCPGVPAEILDPRQTWADPEAYDRKARELANLFEENLKRVAPRSIRV